MLAIRRSEKFYGEIKKRREIDTSKPVSQFATSKPKAQSEPLQKFHTLEGYTILEQ